MIHKELIVISDCTDKVLNVRMSTEFKLTSEEIEEVRSYMSEIKLGSELVNKLIWAGYAVSEEVYLTPMNSIFS